MSDTWLQSCGYFYSTNLLLLSHMSPFLQPLFTALSKLWSGLQDEAELLKILNNIRLNLQPFITSQAELFSEDYLDGLLGGAEVKTDEQRMMGSSGTAHFNNDTGLS